jgi:hypothetical protein
LLLAGEPASSNIPVYFTSSDTAFYWPVPVSVAVCGLPVALSLTWRVALYAVPAFCGENVTLIVQLAPTARVPPQVVVRLNRFASAPPILMLLIVRAAVPELVMVKTKGALLLFAVTAAKSCEPGVRETAACIPVPVMLTVEMGIPRSFVVVVNVAVRTPVAVGLNVSVVRQLAPALPTPL